MTRPDELPTLQLQFFDLNTWGVLRLDGHDVASFLNRLLTFDVKSIGVGEGAFTLLLNASGRVQEAFHLLRGERCWWALCMPDRVDSTRTRLDMYLFGEDVRFTTLDWGCLRVHGSLTDERAQGSIAHRAIDSLKTFGRAGADHSALKALFEQTEGTLTQAEGSPWYSRPPHEAARWALVEGPQSIWVKSPRFIGFGTHTPDVERELWAPREWLSTLVETLTLDESIQVSSERDLHEVRIQAGVPCVPSEYHEEVSPLDIGRQGISEGKGCYPGQEVIERTIALGRPAKILIMLRYLGDQSADQDPSIRAQDERSTLTHAIEHTPVSITPWRPLADTDAEADEKSRRSSSGQLTSVCAIEHPTLGYRALGLIKTKDLDHEVWCTPSGLRFERLTSERSSS
jgi:folate-binding protein YgfZ